jgi:hypothetical protein
MNPFNRDSVKKMPMVKWFDPAQLINTGVKVVLSTFIGEQSDRRIVQALSTVKEDYFDFSYHYKDIIGRPVPDPSKERKEIWIDYICDTGDGWNSTYGVAYYSSAHDLNLTNNSGDTNKKYQTRRGDILVFGGDEVYPTPSKKNYSSRLVTPFENAFGDDKPTEHPHVFAIPGNHDWYDGLSAFSRLFCSDLNPHFAGWHSRQRRSYFALKLPGNWWMLGSDGQLQSDIDTPQLEYFRSICDNHMQEGDKVILCISQPNWIYAHKYKKYGEDYDESDLIYLKQEILAKKNVDIKVYLSGDYHHYRRHEEVRNDKHTPVQKITAGGGGAFLHPTHDIDVSLITEDYGFKKKSGRRFVLKESYPDLKTSKRLTFRNLIFPIINPGFGILTAIIYLFTAWLISSSIDFKIPETLGEAFAFTAEAFFRNPLAGAWLMLLIGGFIFFTDTHSAVYKWVGGFLHALTHINAMFYITLIGLFFGKKLFPGEGYLMYLFIMAFVFWGGWLIGSFIFGLYLFISQYFFGRHNEESFSAARIQDYKNFLRLHISKDGSLTIFPVKIYKVPRKWRNRRNTEADDTKSFIVPLDGTKPELIEDPIVLKY